MCVCAGNTQACTSFIWTTSQWSNCSKSCGSGIRMRTVGCVTDAGATTQPSQCPAPAPASQDSCNTHACPSYFAVGGWGDCSPRCGLGQTSRTVECRAAGDNSLQPMSSCASLGPAPSTSAPCSNGPCPQWKLGSWSPCGESCGDSLRNRTVACVSPDTGVELDGQFCPVPVPPSSEPCNLGPCAHWHKDNWSPCSAACSGGTQTRGIRCRMPHDGVWLGQLVPEFDIPRLCPSNMSGADSFLLTYDPLPTTMQSCNVDPCTANYWRSTFGPCSAACGNGTRTVTSVCVNPSLNNSVVADSLCLEAKPAAVQQCNTNLCPQYEWRVMSNFTECSTYCSAGVSTRHVICVNVNPPSIFPPLPYETVDDSFCASLADRPERSVPCGLPESVCFGSDAATLKTGICRAGQCVCRAGWSGANCSDSHFIGQVTSSASSYSAGVPAGDFVQISWSSGALINRVSVMLVDNQSLPIYIAANVSNQGSYFWQFGAGLDAGTLVSGGSYRFRVFFSPHVFGDSAVFTAADLCASVSCGANGRCVNGQCLCQPAWRGPTCSTPRCLPDLCGPDHGSCNAVTGNCDCKDGFTGPMCRTPANCSGTCLNGGDFPLGANGTCQSVQCSCPVASAFTGANCGNCSLSCQNGGKSDSQCQSCQCPAGWYGRSCECQYWLLTFRVSPPVNVSVSDVLASAGLTRRYGQLFLLDIAAATGLSAGMLQVDALNAEGSKFSVRLRLQGDCASQSQFRLSAVNSTAMLQSLDLIKVAVSTQLSPLFQRYTTSQLDRSSAMQVQDPTGEQELQSSAVACDPFVSDCQQPQDSPSKGGSSGATIGVAVGCAIGALVMVGAGFWYYRSKKNSSGAYKSQSAAPSKAVADKREFEAELTPAVPSRAVPSRPAAVSRPPPPVPQARVAHLPPGWTQHVDSSSGTTCEC